MSTLVILFCVVIFLTDESKLALMPKKAALLWGVFWGVFAYFITSKVVTLSTSEILAYLKLKEIIAIGFLELIIFFSYLFYKGTAMKILEYYPGVMMALPIIAISYGISRMGSGVDFKAVGLIATCVTLLISVGGIYIFTLLKCHKGWLYAFSVISLIIYILIYGIL